MSVFLVFKQKTAYEVRISDWSSDVCSADLARVSRLIGFVAVAVAMIIGSTIGILAGYIGGLFDQLVMGLVDVMLAFPTLLLGLMIAAMLGASLENLIIAIAVTEMAPFARVARAPTRSDEHTSEL